ncbi:MAG: HAMP domain-containing histidine kinase [Kiritimatiellales bacterium]|nr:HAMP domain-containing histidine kinase [Kiritimatiellales bacterium]
MKRNKTNKIPIIKNFLNRQKTSFVLLVCVLIAASITYIIYGYTQNLLRERLRERLTAIVSTASIQFDPDNINAVWIREDAEKPEFKAIVDKLWNFREANKNIRFAYIMRRTDDPNMFEFVADAESLISFEEADFNANGVIDPDEELPMPGDPFDVTEYPVLRDEAFFAPIAERELYEDQWGVTMSGYAPIFDDNGEAIAIIGIDVMVGDYMSVTQATFIPFVLFILFLVFLLTLLTILLVRIYQERVEAMREIDRQKDELLSIVSHQLATPISAVKWNLEMMADGDMGKLTKDQEEHLKTIQPQTENLADLASMILDVSRIQLGRMKVDRTDLDVAQFAEDVFNEVEPKAKEKGVKYVKSISKDIPKMMLDKRLSRMAMENLLTNAVKYTPKGGEVELKVEVRDKYLFYEVKDTGCGIPKKDHDKVFGKLFRASNVLDVNGNGFGLYVAKGAVEGQGGKIWFESKENKGTSFFVMLPIVN